MNIASIASSLPHISSEQVTLKRDEYGDSLLVVNWQLAVPFNKFAEWRIHRFYSFFLAHIEFTGVKNDRQRKSV